MGKGSRVPPFPSTHVERDSNISEPLSIALVSVAELGQESTMLTNVVDASVELGKESAMLTDVVDASVGPIINLGVALSTAVPVHAHAHAHSCVSGMSGSCLPRAGRNVIGRFYSI